MTAISKRLVQGVTFITDTAGLARFSPVRFSKMMTTKHGEDHLFDRLARLPTAASRIKFAKRRRLLSPLTVKRLSETVSSLVRVDVNKARRLASATVTLANKLGDAESRAYALRAQANSLWFMGRNRAATYLHEQATRLFGEAGRTIEVGRTLSSSIQPLILLGEYNRALEAADHARQIFAAAGEKVRLARLEINIGNLFHRQDRFREALACYQRAYSELTSANDIEGIVAALHNVAMCLTMLDEFEKAVFTYGQIRTVAKKVRMPLAVAQAEYNIAYLHYLRGHYAQAIAMLRRAHKLSEKAGNKYRAALCKLDLSEIYLELNLTPAAAELAGESFSSFLHLRMRTRLPRPYVLRPSQESDPECGSTRSESPPLREWLGGHLVVQERVRSITFRFMPSLMACNT